MIVGTVATRTARPAPAAQRGRNRDLLSDGLFLVAIVVGSAALYVTELGFYSDDWAFLGSLATHGDHSSVGPPGGQDFTPLIRPRPTQVAYQTVLFGLFGLEPVGYHVVNAALLAAMAVLFYAALRELRLPRLVAVAVPAVYALLPHYSTDRFWFASFGYTLSMALYFLSAVADLRALKAGGRSRWAWKGVLALRSCYRSSSWARWCSGSTHEQSARVSGIRRCSSAATSLCLQWSSLTRWQLRRERMSLEAMYCMSPDS